MRRSGVDALTLVDPEYGLMHVRVYVNILLAVVT